MISSTSLLQTCKTVFSLPRNILTSLLNDAWTSQSHADFFLLLITALLVGANVVLLFHTLKSLTNQTRVTVFFGDGTLIGITATGCASCGLWLFSFLGLSFGATSLPSAGGVGLHLAAITLLLISFFYTFKKLHNGFYCKMSPSSKKKRQSS